MRVTVIGTGYVRLVTGACLADVGNDVLCIDNDEGKIERLRRGGFPIHEPRLDAIVARCAKARRLECWPAHENSGGGLSAIQSSW